MKPTVLRQIGGALLGVVGILLVLVAIAMAVELPSLAEGDAANALQV